MRVCLIDRSIALSNLNLLSNNFLSCSNMIGCFSVLIAVHMFGKYFGKIISKSRKTKDVTFFIRCLRCRSVNDQNRRNQHRLTIRLDRGL